MASIIETLKGLSNNVEIDPRLYRASAVVGAATLGYWGFQFAQALHFHLHGSKLRRYHRPGAWALVTGASDGIGKAFTAELALRGFNVVLHGRNGAKLATVRDEMQKKYPSTKFRLLVLDSATPAGEKFDSAVLEAVEGVDLKVVIHNVAGAGPGPVEMRLYQDTPTASVDAWIDINCRFAAHVTRLLLPKLIETQPALMLFVSSGATEVASPYLALYTASKCFIEGLCRCLKLEMTMGHNDVEMMSYTVGTVVTASSGRSDKDHSFTMPSTTEIVAACFSKVGYGAPKVTPYFGHWLQFNFMGLFPLWVKDRMILQMMKKILVQIESVKAKAK